MGLTLYVYPPSVYCQIARLALSLCDAPSPRLVEVDPFAGDLANPHPFGLVPVLNHDGFMLHETAAIARYADAAFGGGRLTPALPHALARMAQVIGIADAYAYRPLVRQVYAQRVFRPFEGLAPDGAVIAAGLDAAAPVLRSLEEIAAEGLVLTGRAVTLADAYLAPMIGFFAAAPEGAAMLSAHPALSRWWQALRGHPAYLATSPLPFPATGG